MTRAAYDSIGVGYGVVRTPDRRLAEAVNLAFEGARTVINVGAGSGGYEPLGRCVAAVEPSMTMIRQRPTGAAPAVQAVAEALPFPDRCVDAALAVHTVHHWFNLALGLAEMRRIAQWVVIVTLDPDVVRRLWIVADYAPEMIPAHVDRLPPVAELTAQLPGAQVATVPVPFDCTDRFLAALWGRPEAYLDPEVRQGTSPWHQIPPEAAERAVAKLEVDLQDGSWERRYGHLRGLSVLDVGLRIITAG